MKLTFRKRESLNDKFSRWNRSFQTIMGDRATRKVESLELWHDKFAWYPMRLSSKNDTIEFAWFTKVRQRYNANSYTSEFFCFRRVRKNFVERYTHKDFFKLKLSGKVLDDSENEEFVEMSHDGTNTNIKII